MTTNPVSQVVLPSRLAAAEPGWVLRADVCVVGSGIAGLSVALRARAAGYRVIVVTKVNTDDGSTRWAQGGIAAVLGPTDNFVGHVQDTLIAGSGLCDQSAVDVLVTQGPECIRELIQFGADFDRGVDGALLLTREGGHHANRIIHAGGDATGAEVQRALHAAVHTDPEITLIEHALVLDLVTDEQGRATGVTLHVLGEGTPDGVGAVYAQAVVLASGGMGQIYEFTTNPQVSTGDGLAIALRAGAQVSDVEFVQFHPTALFLGSDRQQGQQPLISEALRGEGAFLVAPDGWRFMEKVHELADLAPRDIVAKAIIRTMRQYDTDHVFLDARHLGADLLHARFPTIVSRCLDSGIDPAVDVIPVAPAAHYASGGVFTDTWGRTSVSGLYACGEVACTGVHGANRLASNSLLEGLVFARRIGQDLARGLPACDLPVSGDSRLDDSRGWVISSATKPRISACMTAGAGVLRSESGLLETAEVLADLSTIRSADPRPENWEATNMHTVAAALVAAAVARTETRGCHWREDYPDLSEKMQGRMWISLDTHGRVVADFRPLNWLFTQKVHEIWNRTFPL